VLGDVRQNYYLAKRAPTTRTQLRRQWLTGLIREVHVASRGTYGYRRVHAELTLGMGITVCQRTVSVLMTQAGIYGLSGPVRVKRLRGVVTADDLVNRKFHRLRPNGLWATESRSIAREKVGSTAPPSWMRSAAASWAGRSTPNRTRLSSSTPWTWPSATVDPHPAAWSTPTTARRADSTGRRNTPLWRC
jgi:hypothetical protein